MKLALRTLILAGGEVLPVQTARKLLAEGGQLVDIRPPAEFRRGTLPGALNLPADALGYDAGHLNRREPVILYGATPVACVRAARLLAGQGFSRIYHLADRDQSDI